MMRDPPTQQGLTPALAPPASSALPEPLTRLEALLRAPPDRSHRKDRRALAEAVNLQLRALPRDPALRPAVARWLLAQLGQGSFEGLVDAHGWSCRAVAVHALLGLGWPWALWVTPEDLAHYREHPRPRRWRRLAWAGLALCALGLWTTDFPTHTVLLVAGGALATLLLVLRPGVRELD
jgi:hypothetical protein